MSEKGKQSEPVGKLYLFDEPEHKVVTKYLAWVVVMVLFVLMILWYYSTYKQKRCSYAVYGHDKAWYFKREHERNASQ